LEYTSGTSEERLPVVFAKHWWNEQEQRALRLNRFVADVLDRHPQARRGTITTPACNGQTCPTAWMPRNHRTFGSSLFLNLARIPFLLTPAELDRMAEEVAEWAPQFLDVDPVHGVWFALHCERRGLKFPSLRFVLCSYEFVSIVHRRIIERALGVPTFNLYGSTETGHLLMQADDGCMKPSLMTAFLELVNTDARGVGDLVVTTLSNDYMPLLRYQIGDLAERRARNGDSHYVVHGRARDALMAANGQRVTTWQVDQLFRDVQGIAHYEVRPGQDGVCTLRYIPDNTGPTEGALAALTDELADLLGLTSPILTESAEVLVPTASGKFRLTAPPAG
jgi:phenylacetate-CoA ligase